MRFEMKLAVGGLLLGTILSGIAHAAEPNVTGKPALSKAPAFQSASSVHKNNRPSSKQKAKQLDKVDLKAQEKPKSTTAVIPETTQDSVQLKGVRG